MFLLNSLSGMVKTSPHEVYEKGRARSEYVKQHAEEEMKDRTKSLSWPPMIFLLALSLTAGVPAETLADSWTTIDFPGAIDTRAFGINENGDIVGLYYTADGTGHGFLLSEDGGQGSFHSIDFSDVFTNAISINDAGDIVGRYTGAEDVTHGYLLRNGQMTMIDFPGAVFTVAAGINQAGDTIVGRYDDADSITHGYRLTLSSGQFDPFDPPDSVHTEAVRINSHGNIVGYYQSADNTFHAFLRHDEIFTTVDFPGARDTGNPTGLIGINDFGDIVGSYDDAAGRRHGFLLSDGKFTTIDFPDAIASICAAINNDGCIVGLYRDVDTNIHGFLFERK
jgi:uncharacterized membrane protein